MLDFLKEYWLGVLLTCITSVTTAYVRKTFKDFKKFFTDLNIVKQGLVALLHNSLFKNCTEYINRGEISTSELDNLEEIYNSYHALGGNGTGTALYERCKNLKIK